jgi:predicted nucleic acid-binding protein
VYLLDTNVVSRTSPVSSTEWAEVRDWVRAFGRSSYLSVISLSELQYGVTKLIEKGAHRKARDLAAWAETIMSSFADRLLPVDREIARRTGELLARAEFAGTKPEFEDACIAATADRHGLTVVTQNLKHFEAFGVPFQPPIVPGQESLA